MSNITVTKAKPVSSLLNNADAPQNNKQLAPAINKFKNSSNASQNYKNSGKTNSSVFNIRQAIGGINPLNQSFLNSKEGQNTFVGKVNPNIMPQINLNPIFINTNSINSGFNAGFLQGLFQKAGVKGGKKTELDIDDILEFTDELISEVSSLVLASFTSQQGKNLGHIGKNGGLAEIHDVEGSQHGEDATDTLLRGCNEVVTYVQNNPNNTNNKVLLNYAMAVVSFVSNMLDQLNKEAVTSGQITTDLNSLLSNNTALNGIFAKVAEQSAQEQEEAALTAALQASAAALKQQVDNQKLSLHVHGFWKDLWHDIKHLVTPIIGVLSVALGAALIVLANAGAIAAAVLSFGASTPLSIAAGVLATTVGVGLIVSGVASIAIGVGQTIGDQVNLQKLNDKINQMQNSINNPSISLNGFSAGLQSDIAEFTQEMKVVNDICGAVQIVISIVLTAVTFGALGPELLLSQILAVTALVVVPSAGTVIGQSLQFSNNSKTDEIGEKIAADSSIGGAVTAALNGIISQIEAHDGKKEGETAQMISMAIGLVINFIAAVALGKFMLAPTKVDPQTVGIEMNVLNSDGTTNTVATAASAAETAIIVASVNTAANRNQETNLDDNEDPNSQAKSMQREEANILKSLRGAIDKLNEKFGTKSNPLGFAGSAKNQILLKQLVSLTTVLKSSLFLIGQDINVFSTFYNMLFTMTKNDATELNNTGMMINNKQNLVNSNAVAQLEANNNNIQQINKTESSLNGEVIQQIQAEINVYRSMLQALAPTA